MKREPQSLTVHLRDAAHRISRAEWIIGSGMTALWPRCRAHAQEYRQAPQSFVPSPYGPRRQGRGSFKEISVLRTDGRPSSPRNLRQRWRTFMKIAGRLKAKLENCYAK